MLKVLAQAQEEVIGRQTVDDLAREGVRRMLVQAIELEVAAYLERYPERDAGGHALVVPNGKARARMVTCGAGTLTVAAPRVNDRRVDARGQRQRFTSRILPPARRVVGHPLWFAGIGNLFLSGVHYCPLRRILSARVRRGAAAS